MIERYVYTALDAGLGLFKKRPVMFDQLFGRLYSLSTREVDAIRTRFAAGFPRLEHAYSPTAATMPCYTIMVGSESQEQTMLSNSAGMSSQALVGTRQPLFTNIWRHQITILCYALQKDMAEYMYEVAKCVLYLQTDYFIGNNMNELQLSGGDISLDEREPDRMFYRALNLSFMREFRFFPDDITPRLFAVDGLFVDDGDGGHKGGVNARITTTTSSSA